MTAKLLEGKLIAAEVFASLKQKILNLPASAPKPKLVILQVLGDEASSIYVKHKLKAAQEIGIEAVHSIFPSQVSENQLWKCLETLNQDVSVHGILIQLPLPSHLNATTLVTLLDPNKDVDGLTPFNLGCLMQKQPRLVPCTPMGIIRLLEHYQISLLGKEMVILNASALVGRPLALLALAKGATVTLCNSKTKNLEMHLKRANIIVSATGKAHIIPSTCLMPGVVIVDVGVYRHPTLGLVGDVEFESASRVASWITPVPGGVGPMTVAMLMENIWSVYQERKD